MLAILGAEPVRCEMSEDLNSGIPVEVHHNVALKEDQLLQETREVRFLQTILPSPGPGPTSGPGPTYLGAEGPAAVSATIQMSGEVSNYDETTTASIAQVFATASGTAASAVSLTVSAGSVIITVAIQVTTVNAASVASVLSTGILASPTALNAALTSGGVSSLSAMAIIGTPSAATSTCDDSCGSAFTNSCDDGSEGGSVLCNLGTDCTDCTPSPPSPPWIPPPSPAPQLPPVGPGYVYKTASLCTNSCGYSSDGTCDDGGSGSTYGDCPLGSDCADCGTRSGSGGALCTSCPLACNQLGAASRESSAWCTESMWGSNNLCDFNCNNWQCAHDGKECSISEIRTKCVPPMNAQSGFLTAKPTNAFATPLEFNIIEMDKFAVALDDTTSQWSMDIAMKISLRWSDFRLADVSCRAKLSEMLSLIPGSTAAVRTEREADRVLIWMPTLELNGSAISYKPDLNAIGAGSTRNEVSASSFAYDEAATAPFMSQGPDVVSSGNTTGSPSTCLHCSQLNLTFTWSLGISPRLSYTNYPFDSQSFKLRFAFGIDSDVFSCESLISGMIAPVENVLHVA